MRCTARAILPAIRLGQAPGVTFSAATSAKGSGVMVKPCPCSVRCTSAGAKTSDSSLFPLWVWGVLGSVGPWGVFGRCFVDLSVSLCPSLLLAVRTIFLLHFRAPGAASPSSRSRGWGLTRRLRMGAAALALRSDFEPSLFLLPSFLPLPLSLPPLSLLC